jgi:hypothetical protein
MQDLKCVGFGCCFGLRCSYLIFEWSQTRCASNNGHHKDMCLKDVGLHAQTISDDLRSMMGLSPL